VDIIQNLVVVVNDLGMKRLWPKSMQKKVSLYSLRPGLMVLALWLADCKSPVPAKPSRNLNKTYASLGTP